MIALIILNLVLAGVGASASRLPGFFTSKQTTNAQSVAYGALGTLAINIVLWLGYTVNASFLQVLTVTFPSFFLGAGLAYLWHRHSTKAGR